MHVTSYHLCPCGPWLNGGKGRRAKNEVPISWDDITHLLLSLLLPMVN